MYSTVSASSYLFRRKMKTKKPDMSQGVWGKSPGGKWQKAQRTDFNDVATALEHLYKEKEDKTMSEETVCKWIGILLLIFMFYVGLLVGMNI